MDTRQLNKLFVTYIDKEGPFLKIWGQTDKNAVMYIDHVLQNYTPQFDNNYFVLHPEALYIGVLCCVKYKDNKYYRVRVTNLNYLHNRYVEVNFIDYGYKDSVPVSNIRSLEGFDTQFISIPPLAHCFLLAEAVCSRGEWSDDIIEGISRDLRFTEVQFTLVAQVAKFYLIRIFVGGTDIAIPFIQRGYLRQTSLTTQEAVLLAMIPRNSSMPISTPVPQQNIATYKAHVLEPGGQYPVYVSYVTEGPCNFSVQLQQSEEMLGKLMKEINSMNLTPIEGIPLPGTVCLARCTEDEHICRAVVTNEVDSNFKVFYVDFGNFEVVPLEALFEISFKFIIPKVMAIRFALAGVEKSTVTLEMQCAFKQFVDNRLMHMRVLPNTARTALPRCELWDPTTKVSALDVIKQAAASTYPEAFSLNRGFCQMIKVSYVYSCNRFYVQLKSREEELKNLMIKIQEACLTSKPLNPAKIKEGLPCYALFEVDKQWYRSQIVQNCGNGTVKVIYVDYGNEEIIDIGKLKPIDGQQLTAMKPQAIECCLNGYQNMEPDDERDSLLEELILEQELTMKVVEMQQGKALVELINDSNYNVASLLLEKIAASRSQAIPMLVQAGNKIEHRKPKSDRRPQVESPPNKSRNLRTTESNEPWRARKSSSRNRDSDDSSESSWRQNNRGFNRNERKETHNNERDSRRKTFNKSDSSRKPHSDDWETNKHSTDKNDNWSPSSKGSSFNKSSSHDSWDSSSKNAANGSTNQWGGSNKDQKKPFNRKPQNEAWGDNKTQNEGRDNDNRTQDKAQQDGWGNNAVNGSGDAWGDNTKNDRHGERPFNKKGGSYKGNDKRDGHFKRNDRHQSEDSEWTSDSGRQGFRNKKSDYKREQSNVSSSESERGFKGFKGKSTPPKQNRFDRPANLPTASVPDAASNSAVYTNEDVIGREAKITITWFYDPNHFYCQIVDQEQFRQMMTDIQMAYQNRKPGGEVVVGAPVIGFFPDDHVLYRAKVLGILNGEYKILFVDYGNICTTNKIWPIEKRFMELPVQAICCSLSGVVPKGDLWLASQAYEKYFGKESFVCKFLAVENERTLVNLQYDSKDIAALMVEDGVATSEQCLYQNIEIPLLVGQQFRAILSSVNSLNDFTLLLQCGFLLTCTLHNLSLCSEAYEDKLKEQLQQILIVYVDNIQEDERLEVTLYGNEGHLLPLMDKNEEAFETVGTICPCLVLNSHLAGYVSHVKDTIIYVQPHDRANAIETLLEQLFMTYDQKQNEPPILLTEQVIYAALSSDGNWYRAKVVSLNNEDATVNYIDYGNSETVTLANVRELMPTFWEPDILCVEVYMTVPTAELLNCGIELMLIPEEVGWRGTLLTKTEQLPPVEPELQPTQPIESEKPEPSPEELFADVEEVVPQPSTTEQQGIPVILSHIDTPSDFYIQLPEATNLIAELQSKLHEQVEKMEDLENPTVGVLCAAPFSLDNNWYRAQVLDYDNDITTVRFVDYGNTDVLDNSSTHIKTLLPELLQIELYATRCRLNIKPIDNEWSQVAIERFENLTNVEKLTAQFIKKDEKTDYVELYSNGANIKDILIAENLAVYDQAITENDLTGFVSHLNSPSEFWIQLDTCIDELERIAEQLSGATNFPELEDFTPGTLCAALFPDDEMWYRARILSNTVAGIEVLFIDYGNSCTSCSLRGLPEDLLMLQPLAHKCSLVKPEDLPQWTPEMCDRFSLISNEGRTIFTVHKITVGETALVKLFVDGKDITEIILDDSKIISNVGHEESQATACVVVEKVYDSAENVIEVKDIVNDIVDNITSDDEGNNDLKSQEINKSSSGYESPDEKAEVEYKDSEKLIQEYYDTYYTQREKNEDLKTTDEKQDSPEKLEIEQELKLCLSTEIENQLAELENQNTLLVHHEKVDDTPEHSENSKLTEEESIKSNDSGPKELDESKGSSIKDEDLEVDTEDNECKQLSDENKMEKHDMNVSVEEKDEDNVSEKEKMDINEKEVASENVTSKESEQNQVSNKSDTDDSRPSSRLSGKISHDDRIPSGVLTMPHEEDLNQDEK